jgi:hypothetical protein
MKTSSCSVDWDQIAGEMVVKREFYLEAALVEICRGQRERKQTYDGRICLLESRQTQAAVSKNPESRGPNWNQVSAVGKTPSLCRPKPNPWTDVGRDAM